MALLIGTDDGLYRAPETTFDADEAERVAAFGRVTTIETFEGVEGVFAASDHGAHRSFDGGETWEPLDVPSTARYWDAGDGVVWTVHADAAGTLYAGTNDPSIVRSFDDGATWHELRGFRDLSSRPYWESPVDPHRARVRTVASVPETRSRLVAGIESGGVHVSEDGGETWLDRRDAAPDDVHQVLPLTADCWLAATGYLDLDLEYVGSQAGLGHALGWGGLHRTTDAGRTWTRLDRHNEFGYIRRVFVHDGTLFFGGGRGAPPAWLDDDHEAAVFESTDFGRTFERVPTPADPGEVVEAWTVDENGDVLCASGLFDVPTDHDVGGRVMRRSAEGYETVGRVPESVGCLEAV